MKVVIIGSGLAGLTAGAYLTKEGFDVVILEQFHKIGGVTATLHKEGYSWDLGPLLLSGFSPHGNITKIFKELGMSGEITTGNRDRGISFPDFDIWKPESYQGRYWRKEYLKGLFPEESEGLDNYYHFYEDMLKLNYLANKQFFLEGFKAFINKLKLVLSFLKVRKFKDWSAKKVTDYFFNDKKLKAVYLGILADMVVKPSEFYGLGVPLLNIETAFDRRIPLEFKGVKYPNYQYIKNGSESLVQAFSELIVENGGNILTNKKIIQILIENNKAYGVKLENGEEIEADYVFASGGIQNTFYNLIGKENIPTELIEHIENIQYMESVLMVHVGTNLDVASYQREALCYYYGTYEIEESIEKIRKSFYHEGKEGFLIYVPSMHSPKMAPPGKHAITIYTIAPDQLETGSWQERREELAEKLIEEAQSVIPDLSEHILVKEILTPEDFRERINVLRHSFGGTAPVMNQQNPSHMTPIKNLWFIGAYSESGGGIEGVITGTRNAIKKFLNNM